MKNTEQMELTVWKTADLVPYGKNSKEHTEEQIEKIANSIREFGWDQPIVVEPNGTIIKGHGRRLAAILLKMENVPVLVRNDLTSEQAQAARIADNRVALGEINEELLKEDIWQLAQKGFSLKDTIQMTGFDEGELDFGSLADSVSEEELEQLLDGLEESENAAQSDSESVSEDAPLEAKDVKEVSYEQRFEVAVECANEDDQQTVYELLTEKGYKCRVMSL